MTANQRWNVRFNGNMNVLSGLVDVKQSVQIVKAGLNFHMWGGSQIVIRHTAYLAD
jgi:hypothetical protein